MDSSPPLFIANKPLTRADVEEILQSPDQRVPQKFLRRHFPRLPSSVRVNHLILTARVQNCLRNLKRSHGLTDLSDLSRFTINDLLHLKNFGRTSLANLLSAALPVVLDQATGVSTVVPTSTLASQRVTQAAEKLRAQPYSGRVSCTDPRFRSELNSLLSIANASSDDPALLPSASLHSVAHRLVGRQRDTVPPDHTLDVITRIRRRIARARRLPLERELEEITRGFVSGRNVNLLVCFYGWSGDGQKTLQAVGDRFGMSRERVRQIARKLTRKITSPYPYAPTLKRIAISVGKLLPATADDVETEMQRNGSTESCFRLDGVASAAGLLGVPLPFNIEHHKGIRMVVRQADAGLAKSIIQTSKKVASHAGLGKITDICDLVQEETGSQVPGSLVRNVLKSISSVRWLDEQSEWFFVDNVPRNHLLTLVNKVLSIAPRIHVNEMRAAISGDRRGMGFAPPKAVVLEFCRIAGKCEIDGDNIVATQAPLLTHVLSKSEQLAYKILTQNGPLLHRHDFEQKCVDAGMNLNTFLNYVGSLPILARYGPGVYGLRGASITPGDVERCIPPAISRLRDHGWTSDAKPWLAIELSPAALSSGVIAVPAGVVRFIVGKYMLKAKDGSEIGTCSISGHSGWGLRPFFQRRGGEAGDVLLLTFDLQRHEATALLGTKEDIFGGFDAVDHLTSEDPLPGSSDTSG